MKKILPSLLVTIALFATSFQAAQANQVTDITTVGNCEYCDYSTIQDAFDALGTAGYIDIDTSYTLTDPHEDITIPAGDWILSGNVWDNTSVVIKGTVTVEAGADAEIQYLTINASGKNYGIKDRGEVQFKYAVVKNAKKANILVNKSGVLGSYDSVIEKGKTHGILAKDRGWLGIENTVIRNNNKAGIRTTSSRKVRLGNDCIVKGNKNGLVVKNNSNPNSEITSALFKNNTIGILLVNSDIYTAGATFSGNTNNIVNR